MSCFKVLNKEAECWCDVCVKKDYEASRTKRTTTQWLWKGVCGIDFCFGDKCSAQTSDSNSGAQAGTLNAVGGKDSIIRGQQTFQTSGKQNKNLKPYARAEKSIRSTNDSSIRFFIKLQEYIEKHDRFPDINNENELIM